MTVEMSQKILELCVSDLSSFPTLFSDRFLTRAMPFEGLSSVMVSFVA